LSDLREVRLYCATPHLGHGVDHSSLDAAVALAPDAIVAQGTSTDPGAYYLGADTSYMQALEVKSNLEAVILAAQRAGVPFIVSTGGSGTRTALERELAGIDAIAAEHGLSLRVAVIDGEIEPDWVLGRLQAGARARRIVESPELPAELDEETVRTSIRIVGQMGPEPIMSALAANDVDGVVTGRALDVGLFAAIPLLRDYPIALAMHFATVMHDGALAAVPGSGSDGLFGILTESAYTVFPTNPRRSCTPLSVAGMSFYERSNPFEEHLPAGVLDVSEATYEAVDDRTVRVQGATWRDQPYTIKLEGARLQGYRTVCLGASCEPRFIEALDDLLAATREQVAGAYGPEGPASWRLHFRVYGRDVLRRPEVHEAPPSEVGILIDALAADQALADAVCSVARSALMHLGYSGRKTTAGNIAVPFSPVEVGVGPSYAYNIWHALPVDDPLEPFPSRVETFPRR
jgi:Acyclic terpene utilisation family protein AtuA